MPAPARTPMSPACNRGSRRGDPGPAVRHEYRERFGGVPVPMRPENAPRGYPCCGGRPVHRGLQTGRVAPAGRCATPRRPPPPGDAVWLPAPGGTRVIAGVRSQALGMIRRFSCRTDLAGCGCPVRSASDWTPTPGLGVSCGAQPCTDARPLVLDLLARSARGIAARKGSPVFGRSRWGHTIHQTAQISTGRVP
jgi:hypothetical protein